MSKGAVDDIARLRLLRYNTRGPGAKRAREAQKPTVEQLRDDVAKIAKKKKKKAKKSKRGLRR